MGSISSCFNGHDINPDEKPEVKMKELPAGGEAPDLPAPAASIDHSELARMGREEREEGRWLHEYEVILKKTNGKRMGIDVDHKDGKTLLIECINEGLVKEWNETAPEEQKVAVNDRIVEVNGFREEVARLVDECQKDQELRIKVARA